MRIAQNGMTADSGTQLITPEGDGSATFGLPESGTQQAIATGISEGGKDHAMERC